MGAIVRAKMHVFISFLKTDALKLSADFSPALSYVARGLLLGSELEAKVTTAQ